MDSKHTLFKIVISLTAAIFLFGCAGQSSPFTSQEMIQPSDQPNVITPETSKGKPTMTSEIKPTDQLKKSQADADVIYVKAVYGEQSWTFHVTVSHPDTGWDDYTNGWDVVDSNGTVLKISAVDPFTRLLLHPHESEQPFTRSQSGIIIPSGINQVNVRAHDLIDGFGGKEILVDLNQSSGEGFEVIK